MCIKSKKTEYFHFRSIEFFLIWIITFTPDIWDTSRVSGATNPDVLDLGVHLVHDVDVLVPVRREEPPGRRGPNGPSSDPNSLIHLPKGADLTDPRRACECPTTPKHSKMSFKTISDWDESS